MNDPVDVTDEKARQQRVASLAEELRPELHRYCSRLMGSIIDGEDVVQDTVAKALLSTNDLCDAVSLRPWLFRVAHNRALDLLRARAHRIAEPIDTVEDSVSDGTSDPLEELMREEANMTAIARFMELPILQRSVLILKDVLDESLAEIAELLDLTVDSVKAHLARGRAQLRKTRMLPPVEEGGATMPSAAIANYVALFNGGNWNGLRALLASDVKLKQSSYPVRSGAADVGNFFSAYEKIPGIWLAPALLEGREVIAVFEAGELRTPSYLMWLEWKEDRICFIRDYRYVRYITRDAEFILLDSP